MIFQDASALSFIGFNPTVCIIGSGPAGITLALQLEKRGISSVIVEAGGFDYIPSIQEAYQGTVVGDPYFNLSAARLRYFGGTSGHWAGTCRPLDEVDFEPRRGYQNSGWPIRKKDLDPYTDDANSILELSPLQPDEPMDDNWKEIYFQFSPPVRFGQKYRKYIVSSPTIGLLLYSAVTEIVPIKGKISHVKITSRDGSVQRLDAKIFCLCTGGIENSRLLLWSNQLYNGGVVPDARTLGKYWMEHPIYGAGDAVLLHPFTRRTPTHAGLRYYAPTDRLIRSSGMGNIGFRLFIGGALKALVKNGLCVSPQFFTDVAQMMRPSLACSAVLRVCWEQMPVSTNRIELDATERDSTGIPRVKLHWKKQPEDRRTVEMATQVFGIHLAKTNQGRMKVAQWMAAGLDYPENDEKAGFHHMGGTRMASTSAQGVVDSDCKVFGVDNLYIGGSSVFPTGGHTNPTYTIVQLALRMGNHLAQRLSQESVLIRTVYPQ